MLISPQYILTAAHCEGSIGHEWEINAKCHGSFSEDNGNCDQHREIRTVSKVIIHPKFDYYYLSNDFALVKLSSPITTIHPGEFMAQILYNHIYLLIYNLHF